MVHGPTATAPVAAGSLAFTSASHCSRKPGQSRRGVGVGHGEPGEPALVVLQHVLVDGRHHVVGVLDVAAEGLRLLGQIVVGEDHVGLVALVVVQHGRDGPGDVGAVLLDAEPVQGAGERGHDRIDGHPVGERALVGRHHPVAVGVGGLAVLDLPHAIGFHVSPPRLIERTPRRAGVATAREGVEYAPLARSVTRRVKAEVGGQARARRAGSRGIPEEGRMANAPSASYSLTVRVRLANRPGMLGKLTSAIGKAGGDIGAVDLVEAGLSTITRDISFKASDERHGERITERLRAIAGADVVNVSDRTFLMHLGGKIGVHGKVSVKTRDDLSMAYTPGRGAGVHGHPQGSPEGLHPDHQAEHGGRGHRRHGRARARRHRPQRRAAGHGGQGAHLQGVRGGRRLSHLPGHQGRGRDRGDREGHRPRLRRHQPRGHLGAALLRDRGAARSATSTFPCSTTTSTAPRWWCWGR